MSYVFILCLVAFSNHKIIIPYGEERLLLSESVMSYNKARTTI